MTSFLMPSLWPIDRGDGDGCAGASPYRDKERVNCFVEAPESVCKEKASLGQRSSRVQICPKFIHDCLTPTDRLVTYFFSSRIGFLYF